MTQITNPIERTQIVSKDQVNRVPIVGARGQLTTTNDTTVYTAPVLVDHPNGSEVAIAVLTSVHLANEDTVDRVISAHMVESGGSIADNRLVLAAVTIPANTSWTWKPDFPMATGEILSLKAGTANTITYRIGVELLPQ